MEQKDSVVIFAGANHVQLYAWVQYNQVHQRGLVEGQDCGLLKSAEIKTLLKVISKCG